MCEFLENNQQQINLMDKAVLEIGAGTGLLSIVASLLGKCVFMMKACCIYETLMHLDSNADD